MNKKCTCCGVIKPITKFKCIQGNSKYGRFDECKDCNSLILFAEHNGLMWSICHSLKLSQFKSL